VNEIQQFILENKLSIKDVHRLTGYDIIFTRQAISGQLKDKEKLEEFKKRLFSIILENQQKSA
jgi:hypothetical protein